MHEIRDSAGNVIGRSRNLRGIRRYCSTHILTKLAIDKIEPSETNYFRHEGKLSILFSDGSSYECKFASFEVLKYTVSNWRNCYGASLFVNGEACGDVSRDNPYLLPEQANVG